MFDEHNTYANTSKVEEFLYGILNGTVSDHVFVGTVPEPDGDWDDMVLIDCDLPISDFGCYSRATVYIFLYARPDGGKNVAKLNAMEEALNVVLDSVVNEHYSINRQSNGADFDTQIGWHRNYVYLNVKIS